MRTLTGVRTNLSHLNHPLLRPLPPPTLHTPAYLAAPPHHTTILEFSMPWAAASASAADAATF